MTDQQFLNYLYWLKDRGQVLAMPLVMPGASDEITPSPEPIARTPITLLFVSASALLAPEREMVLRIGGALGLQPEEFRILDEGEAEQFAPRFLVALGETNRSSQSHVSIPHPRNMLTDPNLKVSAWQSLQKLKSDISIRS